MFLPSITAPKLPPLLPSPQTPTSNDSHFDQLHFVIYTAEGLGWLRIAEQLFGNEYGR